MNNDINEKLRHELYCTTKHSIANERDNGIIFDKICTSIWRVCGLGIASNIEAHILIKMGRGQDE